MSEILAIKSSKLNSFYRPSIYRTVLLFISVLIFFLFNCDRENNSSTMSNDLPGIWYAEPEFKGTTGHLALEIKLGEDSTLAGYLSLMDLDVNSLLIGQVKRRRDTVLIGFLKLQYDSSDHTLSGILPAVLVPKYKIPIEFHEIDKFDQPESVNRTIPEVQPVWRFKTDGPVWGGITFKSGFVYAGSDNGTIYALDTKTGSEKWRHSTRGAIRARPAVHNRRLLVQSDDGYLYCLNTEDGSKIWQKRLNDDPPERTRPEEKGFLYDHYASEATIKDGTIFIGCSNGKLFSLVEQSGEERWHFDVLNMITTTPAAWNDRIFFGSFDGSVYSLDSEKGNLIWKVDTGAPVVSSPAVFNNLVIAGSRTYDLFAFDAKTGEVSWNYYYWFSWVESGPTIYKDELFIGSSDMQRLHAFDAKSGKMKWFFDTGGSAWAQPAVEKQLVFIGTVGVADYFVEHKAGFFAVSRETGKSVWKYLMDQPEGSRMWGFASSPAVGDGKVYVGCTNGFIYAFNQKFAGE